MTFGPSRRGLQQSEAYLAEAQRVSHARSIFWHILSGKIYWSDERFRIFEFPPATPLALELMFERIHPEDRRLVRDLISTAARENESIVTLNIAS